LQQSQRRHCNSGERKPPQAGRTHALAILRTHISILAIFAALSRLVGLDALEWTRRDRRHLIGAGVQYYFRAVDAFSDGD
jgi:hypothetical protein